MTRLRLMILVLVLVLVVAGGIGFYFAGKKVGFSEAVAQNNAAIAKITEEALNDQYKAQQQIQSQAYAFSKKLESEKKAHDNTRNSIKAQPVIQNCVNDGSGINRAVLSGRAIRLLNEAISSEALPEDSNPRKDIREKDTFTADDLAVYTEYSISEYNQCAIQLNSLIDIVSD